MLNNDKTLETLIVFSVSLCTFVAAMKEKIIQKATELFINFGFKSVTMDDIARELGISKKTIYNHFENKTQLVAATTSQIFDHITQGIDCICDLNKNPIEELYEIKKLVMQHLKDEKSSPNYQLQKYYPEVHAQLQAKQFEKMYDCTKKNLQRGVEMGLYRDNLEIEFISRIYFLGVNGIKDESLFPTNIFPKSKLMEDYLEYHLRGIVTAEGLQTLKQFIKTTVTNA
jgi:AcrR family transcriptional regulator